MVRGFKNGGFFFLKEKPRRIRDVCNIIGLSQIALADAF